MIIDYLPHNMSITHKQVDIYTGDETLLPTTNYTIISFDGAQLVLQLGLQNQSLLSQNLQIAKDIISFEVKNTTMFVSLQLEIPGTNVWTL